MPAASVKSETLNMNTVNSLLTDTHLSGQLYLIADAFSNPRLTSQPHSVFAHSHKTEQQNSSGDRFCQISICPREICPFCYPI